MPYLAFKSKPRESDETLFVVYVNTHTGVVPPWDISDIVTIKVGVERQTGAPFWQELYRDGQDHHMQGILTFPAVTGSDNHTDSLEMIIHPPAMRERVFQWHLPIPDTGPEVNAVKYGNE